MTPVGCVSSKDPATAPGFTSMPFAVCASSIAADVRLNVTAIVKDAPAARVAGTPEHWKTSRLVVQPFSVRAVWPEVHLTLMALVSPATKEPNPTGLGVQVIEGRLRYPYSIELVCLRGVDPGITKYRVLVLLNASGGNGSDWL